MTFTPVSERVPVERSNHLFYRLKSKSVRKRVGKCRKHFDVCSLHMSIKTVVIYLSIGRRGGVTTEKGITRRRKN